MFTINYDEIIEAQTFYSKRALLMLSKKQKMRVKDLKEQLKLEKKQHLFAQEMARLEGSCLVVKEQSKMNFKEKIYILTDHGFNVCEKLLNR